MASRNAVVSVVARVRQNREGMMIAGIALLHCLAAGPWYPAEAISSLFEVQKDGVGVCYRDGRVDIVRNDGSKAKSFVVPQGFLPTYYSEEDGLVITPASEEFTLENGRQPVPSYRQLILARAQSVLRVGPGLSFAGLQSRYSKPFFDQWDGVGFSRDGKVLIISEQPMSAPFIRVLRSEGHSWIPDEDVVTPEVEGVGLACIMRGHNDICVVDSRHILFFGGFWTIGSLGKSRQVDPASLLNVGQIRLEQGPRFATGYLFLVDLRSRLTVPVLAVQFDASGEARAPALGQIALSEDDKTIFMCATDGVWRVSASEVLAKLK